jgi:altronate dehydratase
MDELGQSLFDLTLEVASGRRSVGERAGHSQVSIWRDWPQRDASRLQELQVMPKPGGKPLPIGEEAPPQGTYAALETEAGPVVDRIGLVLPTSLCSGQVARMAAERLNAAELGREVGISRYAALVHTEGCGASDGPNEEIYRRSLMGYLQHSSVALALLLEHGCEKTHNDYMRAALTEAGVDVARYGFASVQLDGGIERVLERVEEWFASRQQAMSPPKAGTAGLDRLRLGLMVGGDLPDGVAPQLARLTRWTVSAGGTVVVPEGAGLAGQPDYANALGLSPDAAPTLAHGQVAAQAGYHVMESPTGHWTESVTGLGATGVQILLAHVGQHPLQGHPMIPMLQVSATDRVMALFDDDLDGQLSGDQNPWARQMLDLVLEAASRRRQPRLREATDFQITRGLLGVSM